MQQVRDQQARLVQRPTPGPGLVSVVEHTGNHMNVAMNVAAPPMLMEASVAARLRFERQRHRPIVEEPRRISGWALLAGAGWLIAAAQAVWWLL
jgi:carbon monoxide dehydrogenase subunit G